jgi:hypothetical protein
VVIMMNINIQKYWLALRAVVAETMIGGCSASARARR